MVVFTSVSDIEPLPDALTLLIPVTADLDQLNETPEVALVGA